jgi:transcriptional regulator with XRE-family HTH domain
MPRRLTGQISQLEYRRTMPSVRTLYAIANQLDLVVDDLFRDAGDGPACRHDVVTERCSPGSSTCHRKTIRLRDGVRLERLTSWPDLYVVYESATEWCEKAFAHRGWWQGIRLHDQWPARAEDRL